jgi:hypothetical protein
MKLFMRSKYTDKKDGSKYVAGQNNYIDSNVISVTTPPLDEGSVYIDTVQDMLSIDIAKKYLETKRCVLWQQWSIVDENGKEQAAEWLINELWSYIMFVIENGENNND